MIIWINFLTLCKFDSANKIILHEKLNIKNRKIVAKETVCKFNSESKKKDYI